MRLGPGVLAPTPRLDKQPDVAVDMPDSPLTRKRRRSPRYEPRLVACVGCGYPLITYKSGRRTKKLCTDCFHGPHRKAYMRRYYLAHRDEWLAKERLNRQNNLEKYKTREREIYQRRRDKVLIQKHQRYWADPKKARRDRRYHHRMNIDRARANARARGRNGAYAQVRAEKRLIKILEKVMLTKQTQREWKKLSVRNRYRYGRQLLKRAHEMGIIPPLAMEKLR